MSAAVSLVVPWDSFSLMAGSLAWCVPRDAAPGSPYRFAWAGGAPGIGRHREIKIVAMRVTYTKETP